MSKNIEAEIRNLGSLFVGRLERNILDDAIEYVDFNECGLALRILCDQLCEYDVSLSQNEYNKVKELGEKLKIDLDYVEDLKSLIR